MTERNPAATTARKPSVRTDEPPALPTARVLVTRAAAHYCGLTPGTMRKTRVLGTGPRYVALGPRRVGYLVEDLNAWLAARPRFESTAEAKAAARLAA